MATELGQAYVQIMPSSKGISGSISKTLSGEATSAGKSAGLNIVGALKGIIVTAGIGKAIAATITEGGALQQSIGGIETLFKDNADTVRKYANEAYKTVGVSANEYMENVTSFSASLLQSMGGDTKKSAEVANMAMVDMGDNANKMGTDMRDIQNAYQGFAKSNYTMLDNLKLGYGGTKGEMERLLADATALSGVEYNIDNLADVYSAINVIQEGLGITGTTALEAEETMTGSLNAMKSAFTDVMGNLAIGENLGPSLTALSETVSTFLLDNFFPMVGNILAQLPGAIAI
ncbi:MAG TPA: PblA, partial [Epulopiscium sp.]|nr:PblA [Candidatus Epulonipiscium sp.]